MCTLRYCHVFYSRGINIYKYLFWFSANYNIGRHTNYSKHGNEKFYAVATFRACNQEVLHSILRQDSGYPEIQDLWFSLFPPGNCQRYRFKQAAIASFHTLTY
jgi:hypothetical protein